MIEKRIILLSNSSGHSAMKTLEPNLVMSCLDALFLMCERR